MEFTYSRYLFNCDSLYKKGIKNNNTVDSIRELTIKLSLNEFSKDLSSFSSFSQSNNNLQEKAFLLFYINYFICPYIDIVKKDLKSETNFVLKFSLSRLKSEKFIFSFMNDSYYTFFEELLQKNKKFYSNKSLLLKCNFINNYGFRFYLVNLLDTINSKKLPFFIYFVYND
jgi:hypothetical protein